MFTVKDYTSVANYWRKTSGENGGIMLDHKLARTPQGPAVPKQEGIIRVKHKPICRTNKM